MSTFVNKLYLDKEKDIIVNIYKDDSSFFYIINTPNHHTGNLISNLAKVAKLKIHKDDKGIKYIKEYLPAYINADNKVLYIMRLGGIKVANIYPDGTIEQKSTIPAICKTLMSQTKDYKLSIKQTVVKAFIKEENKFRTDLHTHMNGNLSPDNLIALGIYHQIAYPLYYVKKLDLSLTPKQEKALLSQRKKVAKNFKDSPLKGKYLQRRIDDNTFINFADLILNNDKTNENIIKIRNSLTILKDSQAVFTNLEKLYLYRYVFTKAKLFEKKIHLNRINIIEDIDIKNYLLKMIEDHKTDKYRNNTLLQDKLLWIARTYASQGIYYVEISNTTLVKNDDSQIEFLEEVHDVIPKIEEETNTSIRFLAALRRTPLNIIKDKVTPSNYLRENLDVFKTVAYDPYVVGCDFVGEEINDIDELSPVIKELVEYSKINPNFVIRIHAGENDSLKDNVSNSIKCVKSALSKGQKMPQLRIGHGLYTQDLDSKKGQKLIKDLKKYGVILEFQLTSNVRLNNLTNISNFPLKKYLNYGIKCVQGSDGCGLYGITPIEEQLSLENLIKLNDKDFSKMVNTENEVIEFNKNLFKTKTKEFNKYLNGRSLKEAFKDGIKENQEGSFKLSLSDDDKLFSADVLSEKVKAMPLDKLPIVIAGGSFNTVGRITKTNPRDKKLIDDLLKTIDYKKAYFVIGNNISGYEKYLVKKNKDFEIYSIVPSLISKDEYKLLSEANTNIVVSIESLGMGIYKSFNYEIFERIPSVVIVLDGNASAANLIQEAKNGKAKAKIYVSDNSKDLKDKATSLKGYVKIIDDKTNIVKEINKIVNAL